MPEAKALLSAKGVKFLDRWEDAAIRVRAMDNPHMSSEEFQGFMDSLQLPNELKKTSNLGHLDVILRSAGKDNAVSYVIDRDGYEVSDTFCIGDDINDIPMMEQTGNGFVLGNGYPKAIEYAHQNGLYVSEGLYFEGIHEILEEIRKRVVSV